MTSESGPVSGNDVALAASIGHPQQDGADLESVSPALIADRFVFPVLRVHGKDDEVVPIEQSERIEVALKKAAAPAAFLQKHLPVK